MARKRQAVRCKGHLKDGVTPCPRYAMEGQLVCDQCGGKAPQNLIAAKVRKAEARAKAQLARLDLPPVANALEALQKHAAIVVEWRDQCARLVNELKAEELRFESSVHLEQVHSYVVLFERSMDRVTATLAALARCQVDERLTTIRENDSRRIERALTETLSEAGITGSEDLARARRTFVRVMTAGLARAS
jgi:hypothetical protein